VVGREQQSESWSVGRSLFAHSDHTDRRCQASADLHTQFAYLELGKSDPRLASCEARGV